MSDGASLHPIVDIDRFPRYHDVGPELTCFAHITGLPFTGVGGNPQESLENLRLKLGDDFPKTYRVQVHNHPND